MLAVAANKLLMIWKVDEPQRPTHQIILSGETQEVTFSPDGQRVIVAGYGDVTVVDPIAGTTLFRFNPYQNFKQYITTIRVSPSGTELALGGDGGFMRLYSMERGIEAKALKPTDRMPSDYSFTPETAFSPDGNTVATSGYNNSNIYLWEPNTGVLKDTISGKYSRPDGLTFSTDGSSLLTGSEDGFIRTIDLKTHDVTTERVVDGQPVHQLTPSPDGQWFAFATRDSGEDPQAITTIGLWNRNTSKLEARLKGHRREVLALAFHPTRPFLASASYDTTARLWDLSHPGEFKDLAGHAGSVTSIAFSSDGRLLATASRDGYVRIFDGDTGAPVTTLRASNQYVEAVTFTSSANLLVASGTGGTTMWTTTSWTRLPRLIGHEDNWVQTASTDPGGRWLLTTSQDAWMKLWDLKAVGAFMKMSPADILTETMARTGRRPLSNSEQGL